MTGTKTRTETSPEQFVFWHEAFLKSLRRMITGGNAVLLKISKGRIGSSFLGVPVLLLTTIGRKSGKSRIRPLYYLADGDNLVLVASNAGISTDPAWQMMEDRSMRTFKVVVLEPQE